MRNLRTTVFLCLIALTVPPLVTAQTLVIEGEPPLGGGAALGLQPGPPGLGPLSILQNMYPPGLIMRHETEIGLTEAQREAITKQMEDAQKSLVSLQWEVQRESQKLNKLLEPMQIDAEAALRQADQVMSAEEKLKKAHLRLLIQIKNTLTTAQQEKLRQLRPGHAAFLP
jgi:Spy/CpxP family protein refolding chaperone